MFSRYISRIVKAAWGKQVQVELDRSPEGYVTDVRVHNPGTDMLAQEIASLGSSPTPLYHESSVEINAPLIPFAFKINGTADFAATQLNAAQWAVATADSVEAAGNASYVDARRVADKDGTEFTDRDSDAVRIYLVRIGRRIPKIVRGEVVPFVYDRNGVPILWQGGPLDGAPDRIDFQLNATLSQSDASAPGVTVLDWWPRELAFGYSTITVHNMRNAWSGVDGQYGVAERYYTNPTLGTYAYRIRQLLDTFAASLAPACSACTAAAFGKDAAGSTGFKLWTMQVTLSGFTNGSCTDGDQWNGTYILTQDVGTADTWIIQNLDDGYANTNCTLSQLKLVISNNLVTITGLTSGGTELFKYTDTVVTPIDIETITSRQADTLVTSPAPAVNPPGSPSAITYQPGAQNYDTQTCNRCRDGIGPRQVQLVVSGVTTRIVDGAEVFPCVNCPDYNGTWILDYVSGSAASPGYGTCCHYRRQVGVTECSYPLPVNIPLMLNYYTCADYYVTTGTYWMGDMTNAATGLKECFGSVLMSGTSGTSFYCDIDGATVTATPIYP